MSLKIYGKSPNEQVTMLVRLMHEASNHPVRRQWFTDAQKAYKFFQGEMWTPDELAVLSERKQAPVVLNFIQADYERFEGQYKRQRIVTSFAGRNAPVDDPLADALSDLLRFIDQDTEYTFDETDVVKDGWISGFGVMETGVERSPLGGYRIFTRWEDPFAVFPDPFCRRYDWNDPRGGARYINRSKWMHIDDALDKWPEHKTALVSALEQSSAVQSVFSTLDPEITKNLHANYFDQQRQRVRPVECWWKERVRREVLLLPDGTWIEHADPDELRFLKKTIKGSSLDTRDVSQMYCAVFAGHVLIKRATEAPYHTPLFPFTPFYAMRNADGQPVGRAWRLIDPNREINARRSRALYMYNNRKTVYEKGAIADKDALAENMAIADGQIELQPGYFNKFQIAENVDISEGNYKMLQEAKAEFQALSGEDFLQPSSELRSGRGVAQAQLPYHLSQVGLFENVRRTRRMRARLLVDLIKQYYDDDMVFQITDDEDKVRTVQLNSGMLHELKERTFDIVMKDVTEYVNLQEEQYETLQTTLPQIAQHGPAWAKVLVSTSSIKQKDVVMKQLDAMQQMPPTPPKPSITIKWEELDAVEKAAFALQMGLPELADYEQQHGRGPQQSERLKADFEKTLVREGAKTGREAAKANQDAAVALGDMALDSRALRLEEDHAQAEQGTPAPQPQLTETGEDNAE